MGLHAVLARETDRGMETLAGEIVSARIVALEAFVTAFEEFVDQARGRSAGERGHSSVTPPARAGARERPTDSERRDARLPTGRSRGGRIGGGGVATAAPRLSVIAALPLRVRRLLWRPPLVRRHQCGERGAGAGPSGGKPRRRPWQGDPGSAP